MAYSVTPKRGVGGSNPLVDAKNSAESLVKSGPSAFFVCIELL